MCAPHIGPEEWEALAPSEVSVLQRSVDVDVGGSSEEGAERIVVSKEVRKEDAEDLVDWPAVLLWRRELAQERQEGIVSTKFLESTRVQLCGCMGSLPSWKARRSGQLMTVEVKNHQNKGPRSGSGHQLPACVDAASLC